MKNKKIIKFSIIFILIACFIGFCYLKYFNNFTPNEQTQKINKIEIMGITLHNEENLDITDFMYENNYNNFLEFNNNFNKPQIIINGYGEKTYIFKNNPPIDLGNGEFLISENFDKKSGFNYKHIRNEKGENIYSIERIFPDKTIME